MIDSGPGRKYYDHCPHPSGGDVAWCPSCEDMRSKYLGQTLSVLREQLSVATSALVDIKDDNYDGMEDAESVAGIALRGVDEIEANKGELFPVRGGE